MPTKLTQRADTFAVIGAILWSVAALFAMTQFTWTGDDSMGIYFMWAGLVFPAAICSTLLIFGLLRRTNAGRARLAIAARILAIASTIMLGLATWAWFIWLPLLTIAILVPVLRLRVSASGSALFKWLLVIAWPVGVGLDLLLTVLKVGPVNAHGDYNLAIAIGFATGALLFAAGLALCGHWLRSQKSADTPLN